MLERAAASFDDRARRGLTEAAQLLSRHKDRIAAAYPDALRREFSSPQESDSPKAKALSFESLELMAEDKVDETVELLRAQQEVQSAVEAELTELNALISAAQGDKVVRASANPLRPPSWVRALRDATLQCPVAPAVRQGWMQLLSESLGPELAAIYRQLSQMLRTPRRRGGVLWREHPVRARRWRGAAACGGFECARSGAARLRGRSRC